MTNKAAQADPQPCDLCGTPHDNPIRLSELFGATERLPGDSVAPYFTETEVRVLATLVAKATFNGAMMTLKSGVMTDVEMQTLTVLAKLGDKLRPVIRGDVKLFTTPF